MLRSLSHFLLSCVFISGGWGALSQPAGRPSKVAAAGIPQPERAVKLNGQVVQHESTANMIFSVATSIAFLSSLMTLEPGDIIATGTPSGVGFKRTPPLFLQEVDVVEVEIERIGSIRNPVMRGRL